MVVLALAALLALACAGAAPGPQGKRAEREAVEQAAAGLRSGDKWERRRAVEALADLACEPAWAHVVEALADPKGEVADTAELRLVAIDAGALALLRGREGMGARDPWVRRRIAEALGRRGPALEGAAAEILLDALGDGDAEVRRMALFSVERLAAAGALGAEPSALLGRRVERLACAERDGAVRARALFALARLDPQAAGGAARGALEERDPRVRAAGAAVLPCVLGAGVAEAPLARLAGDAERGVRAAAARALGELGTRAAAAALVERLALESSERLVLRVLEDLRALSGRKDPPDPRPWRDWVASLPAGWRGERTPRAVAPEPGATTSTLAGMPILSTRIAILVDLSGSIWKVRSDGRTKKEVVDEKLREALEGLPETTRFNVIPYTETPHPWKEGLQPATPRNVEAAARFFEACRESGSGNAWDALLLALEDPEVDSVLVLTDGVPTGGRRNRLELLAPLLLERVETAGVALDSVLVEAPPRIRRPWEELARATGGLSLAIDLAGP
jgi:HEAT repeat protein